MKATVDGRPWDRDMSIKWKGAERAQYARSDVKDLTNVRTQIVLSSSNMEKSIPSSLRRIGTAMWCVKGVEDVPSLFPVQLESTWNSWGTF